MPSANVPPKATTSLDFKPNLPGGAEAIPAQDANGNPINIFDPKDSTTYSESFSYSVYDSLGNSHEISQYFVKRPANAGGESVWDVYYMEGSTPLSPAKATL
ncbi:flagellar basal body FlgE domain-containing protein, partial [Leadbetterella sp. DM7]|uniref:flagellar basal body FlgE domain-containing protein n=1 Tax=Leadbetterella sp. DM7 TaxID=3235085 RepID=UPI00349EB2CD